MAQRAIDLPGGDPTVGNRLFESPLALAIALRGVARFSLGITGWKDDLHQAIATASAVDPMTLATVMWYTYVPAIAYDVLLPDATILRGTAELLALAKQSGDDYTLDTARTIRGVTLLHRDGADLHQDGAERETGVELLAKAGDRVQQEQFTPLVLPVIDVHIAREKMRVGDIDGAIELARNLVDDLFASGGCIWSALATTVLVESLIQRGGGGDLTDAENRIDRLAAVPTDPGFVLHEIQTLRLRALLARARGDEIGYRDYRDRYRALATSLGFEGHIAMAEAMP
jgi:adenylate cyclase